MGRDPEAEARRAEVERIASSNLATAATNSGGASIWQVWPTTLISIAFGSDLGEECPNRPQEAVELLAADVVPGAG